MRSTLKTCQKRRSQHDHRVTHRAVSLRSKGTVRHRTTRTKNCVTRPTFLGLDFKLVQEAEKSWRRIRGVECIAKLLAGTVFKDGVPASSDEANQQQLAA